MYPPQNVGAHAEQREAQLHEYVAGNYEFDPFNLYASLSAYAIGRRATRELEVRRSAVAGAGTSVRANLARSLLEA